MSESDRYRLAALRKTRGRDEDLRRGALTATAAGARASQAQVDAAQARIAALHAELDAARADVAEQLAAGTCPAALLISERFRVRKQHELSAARAALDRVQASHRGQLGAVDAARHQLARARTDKELIERHFERWRTDRKRLADRRGDD